MKIIFTEQLTKLRKEKQLSQEDLANKMFISRQAISKWESGEVTPDLTKIEHLAEIFDVPVEFLLFGSVTQDSKKQTLIQKKFNRLVTEDEADKDWHENHRWREWNYKPINNGWEFLARYYWILFALIGMIWWAVYQFK
ncbi:MAG: helix-turn-helix domain-containing protein [Lactobacillaceae bacterium]|jgi:transcriptional regulator with XRE-family HTH domain|nr:helix-turn-helix domain-containing protein [Lactobacillaceae bacterium]